MRIVFFGTPDFAVPTLTALLNHSEFEVVAVVTQPDKKRTRGNQLTPSSIKSVAIAHHIPVLQPTKIKKSPDTITTLTELKADFFVVVAYGQILSQEILDIPLKGCINVHGSLLPTYRGAAPIQWCLVKAETQTGITTMLMDAGMDTGAMLFTAIRPIDPLDNAETLAQDLAEIGANLLIKTLQEFDQIQPIPQDNDLATYAPLIKKSDYIIDWNKSAIDLHNQIRGFYPHCSTTFQQQTIKILATIPWDDQFKDYLPSNFTDIIVPNGEVGEIVKVVKGIGILVQTGLGLLLLTQGQISGKRVQSAVDLANGLRIVGQEKLS